MKSFSYLDQMRKEFKWDDLDEEYHKMMQDLFSRYNDLIYKSKKLCTKMKIQILQNKKSLISEVSSEESGKVDQVDDWGEKRTESLIKFLFLFNKYVKLEHSIRKAQDFFKSVKPKKKDRF
eukprot:TRINITY_DN1819_c0_g2_i3.p1 TRINITY_DN1819_c0_g2~~TRINITY_DN1819_c0_g2_i3.p1  ORF type:complete len:121 (-),score=26.26 TRINITY_DN1819_c0_g2_i3:354-716(-)